MTPHISTCQGADKHFTILLSVDLFNGLSTFHNQWSEYLTADYVR